MPHYVNIAWGNFFGHIFVPVGWRSSLLLAFYSLKSSKRKTKSNVLQACRSKKRDGKNYRRARPQGSSSQKCGSDGRFLGAAGISP
jgi:hypothetical protein